MHACGCSGPLCVIATQPRALAADEKTSKAGAGTVAAADKNFMVAAAQGGMLEVRLGEIAQKKGAKQDVKEFGAMMVADHGKAGEDLKAVAAKLDVKLPADLDVKHKAIVDNLDTLSGSAFARPTSRRCSKPI